MCGQPQDSLMEVTERGDVTVVLFTQESIRGGDAMTSLAVQFQLLVDECGCRRLVFDLYRIRRIDNLFFGMLIRLHKRMHDAGGQMALCRIQPALREVFQITRLDRVFRIYDSPEEALASFSGAPG